METYHRLIQDGKDDARQGDINKALEFFKLANNIHKSQKLESGIKKIEELLSQNDSDDEDEEFINVNGSGLMLFKDLHDKLYDYQRNGVAFLYSLYRDGRKGGILADDMGLGKTIQVISFLSGMYDNELVKHTLLVMPTSLITNWTKEFAKWTPGMRVKEFHGTSKGERTRNLEKVQRRGGVIITTYTMLMNNWQQLSSYQGREFTWDYMILDEAHKIKNTTTKTAKSAYAISSKKRVLLTGTPVQNNLREMWALFDFACQGTLLGTFRTFKTEYENPITRAREKDATPGEKALGSRMSENLMTIIKPYFLRRTKSEVQKNKMNGTHPCKEEDSDNKDNQVPNPPKDSGAVMPTLTRKNDLIVWTYLSSVQEDIYRQFISLDHIKELLMTTRSPLAELNILKKLCDHPRLLSAAAIAKLGLEENTTETQQNDDTETDTAHSIANVPDDTLISESGKLVFLFALLERLRQEGHRTLVFAHYRKVLDIIERILGNRGFKVMRLDGTITQIAERERCITLFQKDERYSVFLLTTQVGGLGLTLTAANRVVIYDPSWNPATDAQAVDRAYRIGQTENVVIYRLITCGTVEEKIYRRQVFKDSLIRQNTGDKKNPFRYFSKQELKELFTLEDTRSSSTQMQLQALHSRHRRTDPELDKHIAHLHAMEMFGISDHDLMFSLDVNQDEALEDQEQHYIEGRVQKAQELMKAESELEIPLEERIASSTEPAWLRQPFEDNSEWSHEKKPRNPRPSPSYPQHDSNLNESPIVVELDESGSDLEDGQQNLSDQIIDLTADESMTEGQPVVEVNKDTFPEQDLDSLKHQSVTQESIYLEAADASPQEVIEESLVISDATNTSSTVSTGLESSEDDFNFQLEDSDTLSDHDILDHQESEAEESKLLSQLQMEGSFDRNKSLSERQHKEALGQSLNNIHASDMDKLMNDSIVATKSRRAAVSYDSEEEDELCRSLLDNSFQVLGASTPKSAVGEDEQPLNETSHSKYNSNMDLGHPHVIPLHNKRLSVLQASSSSFKAATSSRVSTWLESLEGNYNLQLEEKNQNPRPSPSYPQHDSNFNRSPIVEESDHSGSGEEDSQQNLIDRAIDLTVDESISEDYLCLEVSQDKLPEQDLDSLKHQSAKQESSYLEAADASPQEVTEESLVMSEAIDAAGNVADASVQELMNESAVSQDAAPSAGSSSLTYVTAVDEDQHLLNGTSHSKYDSEMDSGYRHVTPLQNKRLSVLQETSSRVSTELQSFNLATKRKRAAAFYDSEDEEEEDDRQESIRSQHDNSIQVLGAPTPKSAPSGPTSLPSRNSVGGRNASVASRWSLLQSISQDMENHNQDMEDEDDDSSERHSDEAREEDIIGSTHDELQLEETIGETLNIEGEEEVEEEEEEEFSESADAGDESREEMSSNLEEPTSKPEQASSERMDQCTVDAGIKTNDTNDIIKSEDESYDSL